MIDLATWHAAITEATATQVEGFTTRELCQQLSLGEDRVRTILRKLLASNKLVCVGFKPILRIDGQVARVPLYQLRSNGKTNGKRKS